MPSILDLCKGLPTSRFAPGEVLLREGERSGKLYFMIDGQVEILKEKFAINIVTEPGAIFGEMSVLLGIPHMATVKAIAETNVYDVEGGRDFLLSHMEITYHLSMMLAHRLHGVTSYLVDLKRQFEDRDNHLGMVDQVLETLIHQQPEEFTPGSDRDPDVTL